MFEKDIYQLIRGLRAHKGTEREYIAASIRECRREIKSQDMDQKATALLKLVYLEMFGHDMSWASFNVLEVMSSPKYIQKRVGYLAAVQSFRPDTEVLMLAENLLKKDLNSPDKITMSLPLVAIPHVINPSMANSLLTDLLPRLSHSNPTIRKKTIVTLYRLALVYPETLRPAWPKIKERLQDEDEDPSVTAAIVNVVCELGYRRPQDFLPLAPRLFELLTAGNNNWMAIKIIKLFSTLTPLEPRLVKKLLPPLTSLIKTTPAMSLLYECINGIIQGGIMEAAEGTTEGDEIARLCVNKLRAMLVVEGDPNLRYVSLLAFAKITSSHADLVAQHQDVILECIDDPDISIRTRALDLVVDMLNANNLQSTVERLLKQLRSAGVASAADDPSNDRAFHDGIIPMADEDEDEARSNVRPKEPKSNQAPPLPEDYRRLVVERILEMCSRDTYSNMNDFEWYIGVLIELVKECTSSGTDVKDGGTDQPSTSMADDIGVELVNVAVRVKAVRPEAAAAAQSLLMVERREQLFPSTASSGFGVLASAAFVSGEYADMLPDPDAALSALLDTSSAQLPAHVLTNYLHAAPKIFSHLTSSQQEIWSQLRQSDTLLRAARITHFLEPLTLHPSLEVQERAVEYLDLMRLASEAASNQPPATEDNPYAEPPLLLTQAIPSLFSGMELNPVAPAALRKVPVPSTLDLDTPINPNLATLLAQADHDPDTDPTDTDAHRFYHDKPSAVPTASLKSAADLLEPPQDTPASAYQSSDSTPLTQEAIARKKAERRERYKDDPYYIDSERASGASTPMHNILRQSNGADLDVDAIPVMELQLDSSGNNSAANNPSASRTAEQRSAKPARKPRRTFEIAADETLEGADLDASSSTTAPHSRPAAKPSKSKSLLQVDSSALSSLSLTGTGRGTASDSGRAATRNAAAEAEQRGREEEEMARAVREVERLRLEMQRREEGVVFAGGGGEGGGGGGGGGVVVKARRRRRQKGVGKEGGDREGGEGGGAGPEEGNRKKKKKKAREEAAGAGDGDAVERQAAAVAEVAKPKRKKKKRLVTFDEDDVEKRF